MHTFVWSARFETGLPTVDAQHRRLVELINGFGEALTRGRELPLAERGLLFEQLERYAVEHFGHEEALMAVGGLDGAAQAHHRHQHQGFVRDLELMHQVALQAEPGELGPANMIMKFLVGWLAFHILGSDQQLARELSRLGQGDAGTPAPELRGEDASARLILDSVEELLRVVADRNRELSSLNEGLELRVAERTAELSGANAALSAAVQELKATQQRLIETAKLASVGQLAAGVAHEINNPLAFIGPNFELLAKSSEELLSLLRHYEEAEPLLTGPAARVELAGRREQADLEYLRAELPQLVHETRVGLDRVRGIVHALKDFSGIEAAPLQVVDLNDSLETVLRMLPSHRVAGVELLREYGKPPAVPCLAAELNQTILALLTNALQAVADTAPRPGSITLRTGSLGREAFLEIADSGVGISAAAKAHLFEPFFTTRPPGRGLGLGLAAAWSFARRHGGRLELQSEQGNGCSARLWLPVDGPAPTA